MRYSLLYFLLSLFFIASCGSTNKQTQSSQEVLTTTDLSSIDFWKAYTIESAEYGTKTSVEINDEFRVVKSNAIPNHPTGEFPNPGNPNTISAQDVTFNIPLEARLSGESKWARTTGVALNGIKFEPETNERFQCETGEVYRVEAFQNLIPMGTDDNHAHVQPTGAYHYHGAPIGLIKELNYKDDIVLVGFALDGFPIYFSMSGKYKPSFQISTKLRTGENCLYDRPNKKITEDYKDTKPDGTFVSDWEYVEGLGQLDECNGIEMDGTYAYFTTIEYPYVGRCLKGVYKAERRGPPRGNRPPGQRPPPRKN